MNNAAYEHSILSFCVDMFSIFLSIYLGVELLAHMGTLTFWETSMMILLIDQVFFIFISTLYSFGSHTFYLSCSCSFFKNLNEYVTP